MGWSILKKRIIEKNFSFLFISILALIVFSAVFSSGNVEPTSNLVFSSFVLLAAVDISYGKNHHFWITCCLFLLSFTANVLVAVGFNIYIMLPLSLLLKVIFFGFVTVSIFASLFVQKYTFVDRVLGAASIYLLIGLTWARIFRLLEFLMPNSFLHVNGETLQDFDWLYFSYITLTTVGYGDVVAQNSIAQASVVIESLIGVLYIAIFIALMIGGYKLQKTS